MVPGVGLWTRTRVGINTIGTDALPSILTWVRIAGYCIGVMQGVESGKALVRGGKSDTLINIHTENGIDCTINVDIIC